MIAIEQLAIHQGNFSLEGISLTVPTGKYGVLMGKTGCGKSSILEAVAGLRPIRGGRILLGETDVTTLSPAARGVGYVPQDGALFRTKTVWQHLQFALEIRNVGLGTMNRRVRELADWLGLLDLLDRTPDGLSGGEAQRVALGRALSFEPKYLLLDEPLSSLDEDTRDQLMRLLEKLKLSGTVTVLHVTHARSEAARLGDVLFRLQNGRLE